MKWFRFCPHCGADLVRRPVRQQMRSVCEACAFVHYRNPTVGVAVVLLQGETVLLGRRGAGHSYAGQWCIPCGHVEWDEEIREAARREMAEETGLTVEVGRVLAVHSNFHDPDRQTVGVWFLGRACHGVLRPGDDLDRVGCFPLSDPPTLAFPTDRQVIQDLAAELGRGRPARGEIGADSPGSPWDAA